MGLIPLGRALAIGHQFEHGFRFQNRFDRQREYFAARQWCYDQFGDRDRLTYERVWDEQAGDFWFKNQQDAFAFKIRWG
jgi:hypothetical protein